MNAKAADGAFRVLWLGDTNALYQGSWAAGDGLAYATSEDGGPDARWLWNSAGPGPASGLASAVDLARAGGTDQLGRLLAPSGVRYVALLTSLAPEINGEQTPTEYPGARPTWPRPSPASWISARCSRAPASPSTSTTTGFPSGRRCRPGTTVPDGEQPDPRAGSPGSGVVPGAVAGPARPGPPPASFTRAVGQGHGAGPLAPRPAGGP